MNAEVGQVDLDAPADAEIASCVKQERPKSFFLFAGAGSGKTRSLVKVLRVIQTDLRSGLLSAGRQVAVITYTNAASDVISQRLEFDPFIRVSTIHSFAWTLIGGYHDDIREWLRGKLRLDIAELTETLSKTRPGTKVRITRELSLSEKTARLDQLDSIRVFTYSPTGENSGRDSLSHSEVIEICTALLANRTLQAILIGRHPFLFIDESQDTNKNLIDAFLAVQAAHPERFCLGLFGDMMQRIYSDGKIGLSGAIPPDWAKPKKTMNWRSPRRVVRLINAIRNPIDQLEQISPENKPEGFARCYIYPADVQDKVRVEASIREKMAQTTGDPAWRAPELCKTLALEHHMAASRLGFAQFFMPLYAHDGLRTGLINRQLTGLPLFLDGILPLVGAIERADEYDIARIVRTQSPLMRRRAASRGAGGRPVELSRVREAVEEFGKLVGRADARAMEYLKTVSASGLFEIPETLRIAIRAEEEGVESAKEDLEISASGAVLAWLESLQAPLSQVKLAADYLSDSAQFDTHQGVKGREFPRVMVIMDPEAERGFLFNYDKLFEVSPKSKTDLEHESKGEETTLDRTRRLFYVTCSRAEASLALVIYTTEPLAARTFFVSKGWFADHEVQVGS